MRWNNPEPSEFIKLDVFLLRTRGSDNIAGDARLIIMPVPHASASVLSDIALNSSLANAAARFE